MTATRRVGGLIWTTDGDSWDTWHAAERWLLGQHRRRDGHVSRDGWYLQGRSDAGDIFAWAGSRIDHALKVASLLVLGAWDRTGLREPDGTVMWRNAATGEERREPEVLAELVAHVANPV
jgi:hypothetical protein